MDGTSSKDIIAKTALSLFARRGFESVGVNEIVEKAGLSKPALYYHFESKDGLLTAIVETQGAQLLTLTKAASEYRHDLVMNLTSLFNETVSFATVNEDFFRLLLRLFASSPQTPGYDAGAGLRAKLIVTYTALFKAASRDHGNMKGREAIYAETFWGLVETCARLAINGTLKIEPAIRYRIIHQYMHGIFS
jgi:TetR/AcrR family transcriptional regulator